MFKSDPTSRIAARRSQQLVWRLVPAIGALLLLLGLGGYLLVKNALSQDADVQQRSRVFISRTLEQVRNEVGRNIINYSKWGEAYKNLHMTVNKVWADEQRNVGDIPFELYGYNGVLVIGPQDHTRYAVIDGKPSDIQAANWLQGDLPALLAAARAPDKEDTSIVSAMQVDGTPALVAAATITPGWDPSITTIPGPASVMIFATLLDDEELAHLSETYGLPSMTLATGKLPGYESMPLLGSSTHVNWIPPHPGMDLLRQTLPLFLAGVIALMGVLAVLLRHAILSTRQIDEQFAALHASQAEARHLSLHDFLTGLPNRYQVTQYLDDLLEQAPAVPLALLYLDLDRFKPVNDLLGHAAGDLVLQEVARRLAEHAPPEAMTARLGGDEFVIVIASPASAEAISELCARLRDALCQPIEVHGQRVQIGTSIGVALAPLHAQTVSELLRLGDMALYQAKSAGRNTWCVYSERLRRPG